MLKLLDIVIIRTSTVELKNIKRKKLSEIKLKVKKQNCSYLST